jgi:hypothetical protein
MDLQVIIMNVEPRNFYYEIDESTSHYYLLGVGVDGQPFTSDDILPEITIKNDSKIGLQFHPNSR